MTFLYCINGEKTQKKSFMLVDLLYKNGSRYHHILRVNECASKTRNVKFGIVVLTNATLLQVKTSAFSR